VARTPIRGVDENADIAVETDAGRERFHPLDSHRSRLEGGDDFRTGQGRTICTNEDHVLGHYVSECLGIGSHECRQA
jgi:hypothetical protein